MVGRSDVDARALRASYDRTAARYDEQFRALQVKKYRAMLQPDGGELREALRSAPRLLDLGGGTGLLAEFAASLGVGHPAWVVLDSSRGMLAHAQQRDLAVVQSDAVALPFATASFALVAAFTVIGLRASDTAAILAEAARVLVPGGRFVATVLARDSDGSLPALLETAGFALEAERRCGQDVGYACRRRAR